jgi:hypothetical protein
MITEDATNEKYFKALNGKINGVIEKILGLLPSTEFAQCITGLIENSLRNKTDWLTTQSLEILCTRLRRHDDFESNDLLSKTVLDQLQAVLKQQKREVVIFSCRFFCDVKIAYKRNFFFKYLQKPK